MTRTSAPAGHWPLASEQLGWVACILRDELAPRHGQARRLARRGNHGLDLLAWGKKYLPDHFRRPPSNLHRWLAEQLDAAHFQRGTKLNVLGPRGAAKSTIGSLALPLRAAVECWEPVHLDRLRHQAPGLRPLGERQGRVVEQRAAGQGFSGGGGARVGLAKQPDRAPQRRDDRSPRHGPAPPRPPPPPAPTLAHYLRRLAERRAHALAPATRIFAELVPRHAR